MYMSYCRHEGTFAELRACLCDVDEHTNSEAEYAVSDKEIRQFRQMVEYFHEWMMDNNLISWDNGELDTEALDEICQNMTKVCEPEEWED